MYLIWRSFLQWADWTGFLCLFRRSPNYEHVHPLQQVIVPKSNARCWIFYQLISSICIRSLIVIYEMWTDIFFVQEDISTIHIQCNLNVWTTKRKLNWKILRIHEVYKYFTYETLYISSSYVFTPSIKPIKVFYQFKLFLSRFYKC